MRLMDVDGLRQTLKMAERCEDCQSDPRKCDKEIYSVRDFCGWLDDGKIVDAIPVDWMIQRMNETSSGEGLNVELNHALFQVSVEWERWKKVDGGDGE